MKVRKAVAGSVLAAGLGVAGFIGAGAASADVTNNPTTNDAMGFGVANGIHNFNVNPATGEQENGVGWNRSTLTGDQISDFAGTNRVRVACPACVSEQGSQNDANSPFQPISNNDPMKNGNKVVPVKH